MRKLLVTTLAFVLSLAVVGPAVAAPGGNPPSTTGGSQGKGSSTTKGTFSYYNAIGGDYTCSEVHIVHLSGNNQFVKDSFTCTIDDLASLPPGTYGGTPVDCQLPVGCFGWYSDFSPFPFAMSWTYTVTDNGNGTGTLTGEAYYPV